MKKMGWLAVICLAVALALTGCAREATKRAPEGTPKMTLLYLQYGKHKDLEIFADSDGGFYTMAIPEEELYDEAGQKISPEELKSGDLVGIYGNYNLLEISPAILDGVEQVKIVGEGTEEEISQKLETVYRDYYSGEASGTMPGLSLSYSEEIASSKEGVSSPTAWDWTYEDYKGDLVHEVQEEEEVDSEEIRELILPLDVDPPGYCFFFDHTREAPEQVTVTWYPDGLEGEEEELTVELEDGEIWLSALENHAVYRFTARWDMGVDGQGTTVYLFRIQDDTPYEKAYQRFLDSPDSKGENGSSPGYNLQEWLDPADFEE